jgi:cell division transport system ATP-binding protein
MDLIVDIQDGFISHDKDLLIQNLQFQIKPGEFAYLIGKSGSGKSSFLKTLYADHPIQATKALCCGYDLMNIKRKEIPFLRRKTGVIFQEFELLFDRSVHQNLEFVLLATGWKDTNAIKERIESQHASPIKWRGAPAIGHCPCAIKHPLSDRCR